MTITITMIAKVILSRLLVGVGVAILGWEVVVVDVAVEGFKPTTI